MEKGEASERFSQLWDSEAEAAETVTVVGVHHSKELVKKGEEYFAVIGAWCDGRGWVGGGWRWCSWSWEI